MQMGDQAGGAREDRHAADEAGGNVDVAQRRRDRHRDVHRQRLAPHAAAAASVSATRRLDRAPGDAAFARERDHPLRARIDGLVQRMAVAGDRLPRLAMLARDGERRLVERAAGVDAGQHVVEQLRGRGRPRRGSPCRSRARRPRPRPAAPRDRRRRSCAPPARDGVRPCSAIATRLRSRKKRWSSVGVRPVASRKKNSVKVVAPIRSAARSRPRTVTRSLDAAAIAVVAAPGLPISMTSSRRPSPSLPAGRRKRCRMIVGQYQRGARVKRRRREDARCAGPARDKASRRKPAPPAHGATVAFIVERLREDILAGRLPPGSRLIECDLTARFAVSRGPVREALRRLSADGLIEHWPHRGAVVRRLSAREIGELFQIRVEMEALAARLAAAGDGPDRRGVSPPRSSRSTPTRPALLATISRRTPPSTTR